MDPVRYAFLATMMVMPLALAGCSDDGGGDGAAGEMDAALDSAPALQAAITVTVNGTAAAPAVDDEVMPINGTVGIPLGVPALFDGSRSTGAILTYAWDFGDNSTGGNRAEEHLYAAPGIYNVTLTVANGNATANATLVVYVTGIATGTVLGTAKQSFDGSLPLMNPNSCTNQGIDCNDHAVPVAAEFNGTPALAKAVRITVTGSSDLPAGDMQVFWRSPEGTTLASTTAEGFEHAIEFAEPMPAGDYAVRVRLFVGASASYTGTVEVTYVTA